MEGSVVMCPHNYTLINSSNADREEIHGDYGKCAFLCSENFTQVEADLICNALGDQ